MTKCPIGLDDNPSICSAGTCDTCMDNLREENKALRQQLDDLRVITQCDPGHRLKFVVEQLVVERDALRAEVDKHRELDRIAAGECMVEFPQPTEDGALLLKANRMMRYEIDALRASLAAAEWVCKCADEYLYEMTDEDGRGYRRETAEEFLHKALAAYDAAKETNTP